MVIAMIVIFVRVEEMRECVKIINQCLEQMPKGPVKTNDGKISTTI